MEALTGSFVLCGRRCSAGGWTGLEGPRWLHSHVWHLGIVRRVDLPGTVDQRVYTCSLRRGSSRTVGLFPWHLRIPGERKNLQPSLICHDILANSTDDQ